MPSFALFSRLFIARSYNANLELLRCPQQNDYMGCHDAEFYIGMP